jgi:hypothetical protein
MATRRASDSVNERTPLILPPEDSFSPQDITDTFPDDENTPINDSNHGEDGVPAVSSTLVVFVLTIGMASMIPCNRNQRLTVVVRYIYCTTGYKLCTCDSWKHCFSFRAII